MYYVCIENNLVISIMSYEPAVPGSVEVQTINDEQYAQIMNQTHKYDVATKAVVPVDSSILTQKEVDRQNAIEREFLQRTDWQVLRHIRQKALNQPTSLTEAEYLALEQQRAEAAARIV